MNDLDKITESLKRIKRGLAFLALALFFMATFIVTDRLEPGTFLRVFCHSGPAILSPIFFLASIATLWRDD